MKATYVCDPENPPGNDVSIKLKIQASGQSQDVALDQKSCHISICIIPSGNQTWQWKMDNLYR